MTRAPAFLWPALVLFALTACEGAPDGSASLSPSAAPATGSSARPPGARPHETDALLFVGNAAWGPEVSALRQILKSHDVSYDEADQADLNAMSLDQLSRYGTIIWPGGVGGTQIASLSKAARIRIRQAVQERGVSWVGFCAGAFVAVAPAPAAGEVPSYGLGIVDGPELEYYYLEDELNAQGKLDVAMTKYTFADGRVRDILWYGGPMTPERGVVARYPDGTAAISQLWSGQGFVVLSGGHPTVGQSVRDSFGLRDSDGLDQDVAWELIEAAIERRELRSFN